MAEDRGDGVHDSVRVIGMTGSRMPRKQRKAIYDAPGHKRRKLMSSHLSRDLIDKYNMRALPVRKGDIVKVMRGDPDFRGKEGRVTDVFRRDLKIAVEGITVKKADNKEAVLKLHPSNVLIIKLDLTDAKRRNKVERKMSKQEEASA